MIDTLRAWGLPADGQQKAAVYAGVIGLHAVAAALFLVDVRLPAGLLLMAVACVVAYERPLWGVGLLIAGRVTSTGANAWIRIGRLNLDLFEPSLMLCIGALFAHAAIHKRPIWQHAPWRAPVLAFFAWQLLTLGWTKNLGEWTQECMATAVLLATTLAILSFVHSWADLRWTLYVWLAASLFIAIASFVGLGSNDQSPFQMAQGSREGGFGQQPNWFAMNLMYAVLVAFGLGVVERGQLKRWALFGCSLLVFIAQMQSGSRGGTGAILIGASIAGLFEPRVRRVLLIVGPIAAAIVTAVVYFDLGDAANAFARIFLEGSATTMLGKSVRLSNWEVCIHMFRDTYGIGIGAGGYETLLAKYDWWLYQSQYRYPHGIFWGVMAHYGVLGLAFYAWFIGVVAWMGRDLLRWTKDPKVEDAGDLRVIALCAIGTLIGYWAWSFVEFNFYEKPFWEFLALYTVLWRIARDRAATAAAVPAPSVPVTPMVPT